MSILITNTNTQHFWNPKIQIQIQILNYLKLSLDV